MLKKIKNSKLLLALLFFIIILALILVSKFALAFLAPDLDVDSSTKGEVTASGDTLIFSKGNDLTLNATTDNFNAGSGNITVTTNPSVKLISSAKTNNATSNYVAGFIINTNSFRYSNGTNAELILTIKDENNNLVTSAQNLTYVTTNGVSGFDITNKKGIFNIVLNHQINTNSSTTGTTHTWSYTLAFVNYTTDQSINENATIAIDVILQKEPIPTIANTCVGQNMASCIKTNYNLEKLDNHTATLPNSAQDGSIRYSGTNPNNYVCFGPGATATGTACPEENQYRIIGVFGNQVKLIKKTSLGNKQWNASNLNTWAGSTMDTYLNGEYLNNLTPTWNGKIATPTWQVGGMYWNNGGSALPTTAYNYEVGTNNAKVPFNGKIGLMYVSDYGFAATPNNWTLKVGGYADGLNDYSNPIVKENNWLFSGPKNGTHEWTISHYLDANCYTFGIAISGYIYGDYPNSNIAVR
ncbi:MAG: DUF6273 domain-containing protein, partial [Bacilli bacterium]